MGGEEDAALGTKVHATGLPPRGRGRARPLRAAHVGQGITPAWAGKSRPASASLCPCRDYPRVGGEEVWRRRARARRRGLPPRGRGRGGTTCRNCRVTGITPAWAGKRRDGTPGTRRSADYPRVGGEEFGRFGTGSNRRGLPPRGRGRVANHAWALVLARITPAWAGKSGRPTPTIGNRKDYPRVGGEEHGDPLFAEPVIGLPPRGRGRGPVKKFACAIDRITPAWAGKRAACCRKYRQVGDYPRVGGEEDFFGVRPYGRGGLPPRGRGRAPRAVQGARGQGITPAWAGKRDYPADP